jgi:hypothetical protein
VQGMAARLGKRWMLLQRETWTPCRGKGRLRWEWGALGWRASGDVRKESREATLCGEKEDETMMAGGRKNCESGRERRTTRNEETLTTTASFSWMASTSNDNGDETTLAALLVGTVEDAEQAIDAPSPNEVQVSLCVSCV